MNIPKNKIKRILTHFLLLFLLYILQTSVFTHIRLFGVFPLIPLAVVGIGLFEDGLNSIWALAGLCVIYPCGFRCVIHSISGRNRFYGFCLNYLSRGFPTYSLLSLLVLAVLSFCRCFNILSSIMSALKYSAV